MTPPELVAAMIALADKTDFPEDHELRTCAASLEKAHDGYYASPQACGVRAYMDRRAKAASILHKYAGETE